MRRDIPLKCDTPPICAACATVQARPCETFYRWYTVEMQVSKLSDMKGGWFVGQFMPTLYPADCEVGFKTYSEGQCNPAHYHKLATEITLVVRGECRMSNRNFSEGDIIIVEPNEVSDFEAITDCELVVFKTASVKGDKYEVPF